MVVYLGAQMAAVAKTIVPPIDLTPISDAIKAQTASEDIPPPLVEQLKTDLRIPAQYQQFLQGTPWAWLNNIIDALAGMTDPSEINELLGKKTADLLPGTRTVNDWLRGIITEFIKAAPALLKDAASQVQEALQFAISNFLKAEAGVFEPPVKAAVDAIEAMLKPAGGVTPVLGNIGVDPDQAISATTGATLTMHFVGYLLSFAGIDGGESLTKIMDVVAAAVGFEELRDVVIGPYIRHGVAAITDMQARSFFRQHLPKGDDVADWMARGIVGRDLGQRLLNLDGFGDEIQPPTVLAAQRGLNPRMFLQLIQTGLFTADDLGDEMTFAGLRPASQSRLKLAAPYIATKTFRDATRSAIEGAYVAGLLSDSDLTEQLDSIEHNTDRDDLILIGAKWRKLAAITKDLEAQYATLFEAGLMDDATLHDHLTAIGLQSDVANAVAARSEARANAALQRRTIADARALAKATAAEERRAAARSFVAGKIDLPALVLALVATGLTPVQAAAWSEIAQLQKTGLPRWTYGLRVPADQATLLRQRVGALMDQRKRQLLSDPQFHDALASLGLAPEWINALRATADAMVTPKAAATLTPIVTNQS
jgi:hypothetical protein